MAVAVDPFSFASVELSEEYVSVFPHPDIIPRYLETVCDKTGVELLTDFDTIGIKGPWESVKKAHTFLADFLASYQNIELAKDHKDVEEFDNHHDHSDAELSPASNSATKFHSSTGDLSGWLKWTAEVLPQIQRSRSKRGSVYAEPKPQPSKVPEPLVLYANFQPAADPGAKKPPTLDAIEKVLKKVYDKDKAANPDTINALDNSYTGNAASNSKDTSDKPQQEREACRAELANELHNLSSADTPSLEEERRNVLPETKFRETECVSVDQNVDNYTFTKCLSNAEVSTPVLSTSENINSTNTPFTANTEKAVIQVAKLTKASSETQGFISLKKRAAESETTGKIVSCETEKMVNFQSDGLHVEPLPPISIVTAKPDQENQVQTPDSLEKVNSVQRATSTLAWKTRRKGRPKKNEKFHKKKTEESCPQKAPLSSSISRAERAAKRRNRDTLVVKIEEPKVSPEKRKRGRPPAQPKTQQMDVDKEEEEKDYVCEQCSYIAKKLSHLKEHKRRVHITKEFKCEKCGKVFGFRKDLKRHRTTHQKAENCCDICGKMYKGVRTLAEHKKTHDTDYIKPEFPCEFCKKIFSTKYVLAYHIKSEHLGIKKTYLCPICGKSFSQRNSYLQHANVHMGIKPYQCDICGRSFSYEKSLKEHKYMHADDKQFECPECHKKFRQSSGVAIHMKIHKAHKDYVCSACGKGFSQKQALIRHERIHIGEKPFNCSLCQRKFTDSSILRRHMILIHKKDPKKWREDTQNNVQRRTDFFINVVGEDDGKETKKTAAAGDNPASTVSDIIESKHTAQEEEVNGVSDEDIHSDGDSCPSQAVEDSEFSFIPVGVVPTAAAPASSLDTAPLPSLLTTPHHGKPSHQTPAADEMVTLTTSGHHDTEVAPGVHKVESEDAEAVTSYAVAIGSVLPTNSNKDAAHPVNSLPQIQNPSNLHTAILTSYAAYDNQPHLQAELYSSDMVSQPLQQYSAVLAQGSVEGSLGLHHQQSMMMMPSDSDALSFHAEPVRVLTTVTSTQEQQPAGYGEAASSASASSSSQ